MVDSYRKRNRVYKEYAQWIFNAIDDNIDASITGADMDDRLGLFNMFHMLVELRNDPYASCRPLCEDIECMSDKLFCDGVDTSIMEKVFPSSYDCSTGKEFESYDPADPNSLDGVDYMQIEGVGTQHPKNRVR